MATSDMDKASAIYALLKANNLIVDISFEKPEDKETISRVNRYAEARKFELEGLRYLREGNYEQAIANFRKAEYTVNGYHRVYEICRLLERKLSFLRHNSPDVVTSTRKEVLGNISCKNSLRKHQKISLIGPGKRLKHKEERG